MGTLPFASDVAQLITATHEVKVTARAVSGGTTVTLDLEDYTVDWTERRTPRVSAVLTCPIPDEATLALLDPRTYVRVVLTAAYRLPSGTWDTQDVAHLMLRARNVNRPANTLTLTCASHESAVLDFSLMVQHPDDYGTGDMSQTWASASDMTARTIADMLLELRSGPMADVAVIDEVHSGPATIAINPNDRWDGQFMVAAEQLGYDVFDNGDKVIRCAPLPTLAPETALTLTVGASGTILESDAGVDRDDWANFVTIRYKWQELVAGAQVDRWTYGQQWVQGGPYAPASSGWRVLVEDRPGHPSEAQADQAAANLLVRMLSRSRSLTIRSVSAWWLRAGHTVTVQLPTGAQERHLVVGVTFHSDNTMTVVTRLPDAVSTIGA